MYLETVAVYVMEVVYVNRMVVRLYPVSFVWIRKISVVCFSDEL